MSSGNTTNPSDPAERPFESLFDTLVYALAICQCVDDPARVGEVALLHPGMPGRCNVGREVPGGPARQHFGRQLPGEHVDGGPLTGLTISQDQLRFTYEGDDLRMHNVGRAPIFVDGTRQARNCSVLVRVGTVIEIYGHSVLLVIRRPLALRPRSPRLGPLHSFGEPCPMGFTGESPAAHEQREDTAYAASLACNVLAFGPTGSGKELVARAIHARSRHASRAMIPANCAQFTAELTGAELFGSPKNWPNPGTPERVGYFGEAEDSTLFLDEIGELREELQSPLLRALEGSYNRVGESRPRKTRCRVVAATNRPLVRIKEDVRMRFGALVRCPALADRREDIMLIARQWLLERARKQSDFAEKFVKHDPSGRPYVEIEGSFVSYLLRCPLTGNVRELRNILEMSIAAADSGPPLRWPAKLPKPDDAVLDMREEDPGIPVEVLLGGLQAMAGPRTAPPPGFGERPAPGEVRVREVLSRHARFDKAAEELEITPDQLYRLRIKYGIRPPE